MIILENILDVGKMLQIEKKVAVVTGASRGIGRAIAHKLSTYGATVVINYNSNKVEATKTQSSICSKNTLLNQADISKESECKRMFELIISKFGKIDILINNAGIIYDFPIKKFNSKRANEIIDTNFKGTLFCIKEAVKYMDEGVIINIVSDVSFIGIPNISVYTASKSAVIGLTKSLAKELAPDIRVNCVAPGIIATDMTKSLLECERENLLKNVPLQRFGMPDDVANCVVFLVSDYASYITGQTIVVDGGRILL